MSETKKRYQPTCEDFPEDDQAPAPHGKATSKRSQSKPPHPPPTSRKTSAPDTASVDSGYSSKTAATQESGESGGAPTKTAHPIRSNAPAAASLPHQRSASSDARRLSSSNAPAGKLAPSPTKNQQQQNPKAIPPPIFTVHTFPGAVAPLPHPMASPQPCNCPECTYYPQHGASQHYSPLATSMDLHYRPSHYRHEPPQPSPTGGHFPPSSYAGPQPRRRPPSGAYGRPRPATYHEQWGHAPLQAAPASAPGPAPTGPGPMEHYHVNPSHHYPPPSASQPPRHGPPEPYRRPSTTAATSAYAPPPHAHAQPQIQPPSPQGAARPPITHYDTEGAVHPSAMVHHMYGSAPRTNPGLLPPPHYRMRRSTSPGNLVTREARDRLLMPPPPQPPRPSQALPVRSASTRRPSPSHYEYERRLSYDDYEDAYLDDEYEYDEETDWDRTIRAKPRELPRPSILEQHESRYHSTSSVPQRASLELSRGRRRSSVGHRGVERDRLGDAEEHIARTSTRTKDLTAERVKKINRDSLDSSSRSQKSRGGSERDGASSYVSKGDGMTKIRVLEDQSYEIEGPGIVRVVPGEDGSKTQFIVENSGGRETKYHKEGSRTSRASNKSFASRASRSGRPGEPIKEGRQKAGSEKATRRKAKGEKPEVVVEDGEARN